MAKHQFQRDEDGDIDDFAFDVEEPGIGHNGPRCTVCGESICHHCEPKRLDEECPGKWIQPWPKPEARTV
ncbi:hypothetical protein [Microbispora sp. GKU 823]|uniref:hypothetical protein n=1 Tax=Microbispora sp. GKU 823 TaxID=1652100 RepID=UPI00117EBA13|nr:hypothetical protein [Microbispora sp. GKU 823]